MLDTIVMLEERNLPYPRFPQCDMFVPQKSLNGRHLETALYRQGMDRKRSHLSNEEAQKVTYMARTAYRFPLSQITSFKYLG